jgi:hypothetical protein
MRKVLALGRALALVACTPEQHQTDGQPPASVPETVHADGRGAAASVSDRADRFLADCERTTTVMGRTASGEIEQIGETIDDYCAAYLQGTFDAMLRARAICAESASLPDEQLLLSILRTYAEHSSASGMGRAEFVAAALSNAYACHG